MGFGKVECQDDSYSLMHQPCPYCLRLTRARAFLLSATLKLDLWEVPISRLTTSRWRMNTLLRRTDHRHHPHPLPLIRYGDKLLPMAAPFDVANHAEERPADLA